MLVRDARDGDMAEIQAIYAHHVLHGTASFEEEAPPLAEMQRRRADVLACGLPYLVAEICPLLIIRAEDIQKRLCRSRASQKTPPDYLMSLPTDRSD